MVLPLLSSSRYSRGREDATKPAAFRFPSQSRAQSLSKWMVKIVVLANMLKLGLRHLGSRRTQTRFLPPSLLCFTCFELPYCALT